MFIFGPDNVVRKICTAVVHNKYFESLVLALIGASCVTIALDEPGPGGGGPSGQLKDVLHTLDWCFTSFFCLEVLLKLIALVVGLLADFTPCLEAVFRGARVRAIYLRNRLHTNILFLHPRAFEVSKAHIPPAVDTPHPSPLRGSTHAPHLRMHSR